MTTNHGNPAFPVGTQYLGMMLRDYFAAQAMQGMLTANGDSDGYLSYEEETVAANAYKLADAMLKVRSK